MSYQILPHTADMGFRVRGSMAADLVEAAGSALADIILDTSAAQSKEEVRIEARGAGFHDVLVNWLNEVLFLIDARRLVLRRFHVELASDSEIRATAQAEPRDDRRHPPRLVVKAVTYHQLEVRETEGSWQADIYLDV